MLYIEQNPLKANIVQVLEEYPYSSYHYFLDVKNIPERLKQSWVVQNFLDDTEAIQAFLNSTVDTSQLNEMRKASSLIEASNVDKKPDEVKLRKILELNQSTVQRIIKKTEV